MFRLIKIKKAKKLRLFYSQFNHSPENWCLILINTNYLKQSPITREIDIHSLGNIHQIKISQITESLFFHQIFQNRKKYFSGKMDLHHYDSNQSYNNFCDQLIHLKFVYFGEKLKELHSSPSHIDVNNQESRALEWLRVSFKILKEALEKNIKEEFSFSFFMGINPIHQLFEIRLTIFNLDIQYILLPQNTLRIRVFDTKNESSTTTQSHQPKIQGDFTVYKKEMFEELIQVFIVLRPFIHFRTIF